MPNVKMGNYTKFTADLYDATYGKISGEGPRMNNVFLVQTEVPVYNWDVNAGKDDEDSEEQVQSKTFLVWQSDGEDFYYLTKSDTLGMIAYLQSIVGELD